MTTKGSFAISQWFALVFSLHLKCLLSVHFKKVKSHLRLYITCTCGRSATRPAAHPQVRGEGLPGAPVRFQGLEFFFLCFVLLFPCNSSKGSGDNKIQFLTGKFWPRFVKSESSMELLIANVAISYCLNGAARLLIGSVDME